MKRQTLWAIMLFVLWCYAWAPGALAQAAHTPGIDAVTAVGMTVADMERSVQFSSLGFTAGLLVRDPHGHAVQVIER